MTWLKIIFVCALILLVNAIETGKKGVQLRLTEKGMFYAVDVGIKIMQEDLKGKAINEEGESDNVKYKVENLKITEAVFANYKLTPVAGVGMRGQMSGISISASGNLWFKYSKWFIHLSDTIGISLSTKNIHMDMTAKVGADKSGHPTIDVTSCNAGVSDVDLHFHGSGSWLYNIFRKIISGKLKDSFGKLLCSIANKEINERAKSELETFPVVKKIDEYAEIDYRLTAPPKFTVEYMDAYLKGEFKSSQQPTESQLSIPSFTSKTDHAKMLYFWVTDYTINTAGEVYHNAGRLSDSFNAWDPKVPSELKSLLTTTKFALLFPKLITSYPGALMGVELSSFKSPRVVISPGRLRLYLYANAAFKVKDKHSQIKDVFTIQFSIKASASVTVLNNNIGGKITDFSYDATVTKTTVGKNTISLNSFLVKAILDRTVISKANPVLKKGFPLPKVDEVSLQNFDIELQNDVIRIGSDVHYAKDKK